MMRKAAFATFAVLVACGPGPAPAPPQPQVLDAAPAPFPYDVVWTARPDVALSDGGSRAIAIERPVTRLDVVGLDPLGIRVRCTVCAEQFEGYVSEGDLVFTHFHPEVSAWADLPEFALAIRDAASRRDLDALRSVMVPDFSYSFIGIQTPEMAFEVWSSEGFATLDRVPDLLDQGLATSDGRIWSAPPAFLDDPAYRGPRLGFRLGPGGRWEWLFLIRGMVGGS